MLLACILGAMVATCPPPEDLLALAPAPLVAPELRPDPAQLVAQLASSLRKVVPGTLVGPFEVGDLGALVAAVRCTGVGRNGAPSGSCEVVVAHLTPVADASPGGRSLELSGMVGALPLRGRGGIVSGLAVRDVMRDGLPEIVVRGRALDRRGAPSDATWAGLLVWDGLARVWGPEPVGAPGCTPELRLDDRACGPRPALAAVCGSDVRRFVWRPDRDAFVKERAR